MSTRTNDSIRSCLLSRMRLRHGALICRMATIALASGDATWNQGPHVIVVEGSTVINQVTTQPNEFLTLTDHLATVTDGSLSIAVGGSTFHSMLNYVIITPITGG